MKYHDESTNVSIVSVSRLAFPLHFGQGTFRNFADSFNGEPPVPVNFTSSGSITGSSFSGTGTAPHLSQ